MAEAIEQSDRITEAGRHNAVVGAVLIAIMAAALAICTVAGNNAANTMILSQGKAADSWNRYESFSIRAHSNENDTAILRLLASGAQRQAALRAADALQRQARNSFLPEQNALYPRALALEETRDHAEHSYHTFEYAESALQLAVVLASASVATAIRALLGGSVVIGVFGFLLTVAGLVSFTIPGLS